jgi:uncharacterized DUF497 family protein
MDTGPVFEWDDHKRRSNLRKHGLDFGDCGAVFSGPVLTILDDRADYGETRFLSFGLLRDKVVVIAHTEESRFIRIISMRTATAHEEADYFETAFQD